MFDGSRARSLVTRKARTALRLAANMVLKRERITILTAGASAPAVDVGPLRIRTQTEVRAGDALSRCIDEAGPRGRSELERRRRLGDVCYVVVDAERCVHFSWVTSRIRHIEEIGARFRVHQPHRWVYDAYTSPAYRGRSIFTHVLETIVRDARAADAAQVWIDVEDGNASSLRSMHKAGFHSVATLDRRVLLSLITMNPRIEVANPELRVLLDRFDFEWRLH